MTQENNTSSSDGINTQEYYNAQEDFLNSLEDGEKGNNDVQTEPFVIGIKTILKTIDKNREWDESSLGELNDQLKEAVLKEYNPEHISSFNSDELRVWHMGLFGAIELIRQYAEWKHYDTVNEVMNDFNEVCDEKLFSLREKYAYRIRQRHDIMVGEYDEENDKVSLPLKFGRK